MDINGTRYLSLLKKSLINELYAENEVRILRLVMYAVLKSTPPLPALVREFLNAENSVDFQVLMKNKEAGGVIKITTNTPTGPKEFTDIRNFTFTAHSMIGRLRMQNLHDCLDAIVADKVPGDLIETGVWKGGATIFMRGFLAAHGITDRTVWVADSFEGLPLPTMTQDAGVDFSKEVFPYLAISLDEVQALFRRYDLLDDQVRFLKGWFKDTLPTAPIERLAILRLDGDMYESTMDGLVHLYHRVSPGGFIIVDDYFGYPGCKQAVDEFRAQQHITEPMLPIDEYSCFWRKSLVKE